MSDFWSGKIEFSQTEYGHPALAYIYCCRTLIHIAQIITAADDIIIVIITIIIFIIIIIHRI